MTADAMIGDRLTDGAQRCARSHGVLPMQGEPHRDGACAWWPSPNGVPVTCRCLRRHAEAGQERQVVWLVDAVAATAPSAAEPVGRCPRHAANRTPEGRCWGMDSEGMVRAHVACTPTTSEDSWMCFGR
jgi:hypothetical protein